MDSVRWKIDDALDLPLAVIEDTEDGEGVCEVANPEHWPLRDDAPTSQWETAKEIVKTHNAFPDLLKACQAALDALKPSGYVSASQRKAILYCQQAIAKATEEKDKDKEPPIEPKEWGPMPSIEEIDMILAKWAPGDSGTRRLVAEHIYKGINELPNLR